jgi:uncharacterized alkaline shock family protein YloU
MSNTDISNIQISNDVISTIAGIAAMEVDGVSSLTASLTSNIKELIYKKSAGKGVSVENCENGDINITVNLIVKYNYNIQDVALNVQNQIIRSVSDMTNFNVAAVNVNVMGVNIPKETETK